MASAGRFGDQQDVRSPKSKSGHCSPVQLSLDQSWEQLQRTSKQCSKHACFSDLIKPAGCACNKRTPRERSNQVLSSPSRGQPTQRVSPVHLAAQATSPIVHHPPHERAVQEQDFPMDGQKGKGGVRAEVKGEDRGEGENSPPLSGTPHRPLEAATPLVIDFRRGVRDAIDVIGGAVATAMLPLVLRMDCSSLHGSGCGLESTPECSDPPSTPRLPHRGDSEVRAALMGRPLNCWRGHNTVWGVVLLLELAIVLEDDAPCSLSGASAAASNRARRRPHPRQVHQT